MGLIGDVDVSIYANPKFAWQQMEQIRLGLKEGLDVSEYAKPEITAKEMEQIREKSLKEKNATISFFF